MPIALRAKQGASALGSRAESVWRLALVGLLNAPTVLAVGVHETPVEGRVLVLIQAGLLLAYVLSYVLVPGGGLAGGAGGVGGEGESGWRGWLVRARRQPHIAAALVGLVLAWWTPALEFFAAVVLVIHLFQLYASFLARGVSPALLLVISFLTLIAIGTAVLMLPRATPEGSSISLVDALFTATSAVCVTGLVVRDTGTEFTRLGQTAIMVLMQFGGLGIVLFGSFMALLLGSSLSARAEAAIAESSGRDRSGGLKRIFLFGLGLFLITELACFVALYFGWPRTWAGAPAGIDEPGERAYHAAFFAVSAFCNAGFATTEGSLEGLRFHWTTHIAMAGTIVIGGIGLPAMINLAQVARAKLTRRPVSKGALVRLNLHTKLVIAMSIMLYVVGLAAILVGRFVQSDQGFFDSLVDAHFLSLASRTAGFNTVPTGDVGPLSRFILLFLMFCGGSPGSTAGGIKTIVVGVLVITVWSTLIARPRPEAFGRTISDELVRKAAVLIALGLATIVLVTAVLSLTDQQALEAARGESDQTSAAVFEQLLFESVSACSTVGLSLGITDRLSDAGRLTITAAMFVGRVGPLVFLVALTGFARKRRARYSYPTEELVMS